MRILCRLFMTLPHPCTDMGQQQVAVNQCPLSRSRCRLQNEILRLINLKYLATQLSCRSPVCSRQHGYPQWTGSSVGRRASGVERRARFVLQLFAKDRRTRCCTELGRWDRVGCGVCVWGKGNYNCQSCLHKFYWIEPLAGPGNSRNMRPKTYKTAPCLRQAGRQAAQQSGGGVEAGRQAAKGNLFGVLRLFDYFIFCRRLYMALNWIVTNFVARYSKRFIAQPVCKLASLVS